MLLSKPKIDYSSVRRMPTIKLGEQTQGTAANTIPTSASLQDISSHTQKFNWNNNNNNTKKTPKMVHFSEKFLPSSLGRQLNTSHSDERIFEHPEVTIKPSALDDELQRRLLTLKTSNTTENLVDRDGNKNEGNILEHPDMRSPVIMQPHQITSSASSAAILMQNDSRRLIRTQSANASIIPTTSQLSSLSSSPINRVEFFIDNQQNSKRNTSPGPKISDIVENSEQEQTENPRSSSSTKIVSTQQQTDPSSTSITTTRTSDSS